MSQLIINTGSNAWLRSDQPDTVQTATSTLGFGWSAGASSARRPLLRFSLAALPANAVVSAASVSLFQNAAGAWAASAYLLSAAWVAAQATWNSRATGTAWTIAGGDYSALPVKAFTTSAQANKSVGFDVTVLLAAARTAGAAALELLIRKDDESGSNAFTNLNAFGGAGTPALTIDYTIPAIAGRASGLALGVGVSV